MAATQPEYIRLPGSRSRHGGLAFVIGGRSRLWLGKDHLLRVDSTGYAEEYKRFYFRDIQAVTIRRTPRGKIWNAVLATPFGICAIVLAVGLIDIRNRPLQTDDLWGFVGWGTPAFLFLACLVINILSGPTCLCHLRTAVQVEEVPSLCRLPRAFKVLDRIRPLIIAAQGEVSARDLRLAPPVMSEPVSGQL